MPSLRMLDRDAAQHGDDAEWGQMLREITAAERQEILARSAESQAMAKSICAQALHTRRKARLIRTAAGQ